MFRCYVMLVKVGSRSQKSDFLPQPVVGAGRVNALGSSDQIFQIAVISEYVSRFG